MINLQNLRSMDLSSTLRDFRATGNVPNAQQISLPRQTMSLPTNAAPTMAQSGAAQSSASQNPAQRYLQMYPDVMREAQRQAGFGFRNDGVPRSFDANRDGRLSPDEYAQWHYQNYGQNEGREWNTAPQQPSRPTPEPIPYQPIPQPGPPTPAPAPMPAPVPGPTRPVPGPSAPAPTPANPAPSPTTPPPSGLPVQQGSTDPFTSYVAPIDVPYYGYGGESALYEQVPELTLAERQQQAIADFQNSPEYQITLANRFAPTSQEFEADPGYQFRVQEGTRALDQSAAARGMLLSGKQIKDLEQYRQGLASQEYGNWYQRASAEDANRYARYSTEYGNFVNNLRGIAGLGTTAGQTANNVTPFLGSGANAFGQMGQAYANQGANLANIFGANANAQGAIWGNAIGAATGALGNVDWGQQFNNWFGGGNSGGQV